LNVFIIEFKYFPQFTDQAQEKSRVRWHIREQLDHVRDYEQHDISEELVLNKLLCLLDENVINNVLKSLLLIDSVRVLCIDVFYHFHELKFRDS